MYAVGDRSDLFATRNGGEELSAGLSVEFGYTVTTASSTETQCRHVELGVFVVGIVAEGHNRFYGEFPAVAQIFSTGVIRDLLKRSIPAGTGVCVVKPTEV